MKQVQEIRLVKPLDPIPSGAGGSSLASFMASVNDKQHSGGSNPDEPDRIKLKPSNLSDTGIIRPSVHVWVSEKQNWYSIPDGVAVYDKQP